MELPPLKDLTLKSLLRRSAEVFAQRPALSFVDGEPVTFAALYERVQETSQFLRNHGISGGDRVAILSENMPNWGIAFFAITTMGSVVVPILPDFHPNEINHILRHAECKAIFVSDRLYGKLEEGQIDTLSTIIRINDFHLLSPESKQEKFKEAVKEGGKEFARLKEAAIRMTRRKPAEDFKEDDIVSIISTSGSTGSALHQRMQALTQLLQKQGIGTGDRIVVLSEQHPNWTAVFLAIQAAGAVAIPVSPEFRTEEIQYILRHSGCKAVCISAQLREKIENAEFDALTPVISMDDFRLIPLETAENRIRQVLQQFNAELKQLQAGFSGMSPETARTKLKELLRKGTQELQEAEEEAFPSPPFELAKDQLRELLQYGKKELEKLTGDASRISPETTQDKLREFLQYGLKELEKLRKVTGRKIGKLPSGVKEDDLASIIYTSGTTGKSKGVMLRHRNIVSNALSAAEIISYMTKGEERFMSVLPLSHTYECTIGFIIPLMWGSCIYYLDKPPTARVLLPAMQKIRPTMMLTVPLIIEKIYKMRILPQLTRNALMRKLYSVGMIRKRLHKIAGKKLHTMLGGQLHFFGIGGAPLSPEVEAFLREGDFPYAVGYGLSETAPLIAGSNAKLTRYRATGPAITGVEVKIDNPNPETGEGEILVRGPNVMQGYYKAPVLTAEVLSEDGWFRTGDLGVFDKDRYLYIKGRLKNMILGPSGENIYPEEIEAAICEHEYVQEAIVYKLQDQLVARVHLDYDKLDEEFSGQKLSESQIQDRIKALLEDLRKSVNVRVSSFSRLNRIIEQPEPFEKTPTKKIKRYLYVN